MVEPQTKKTVLWRRLCSGLLLMLMSAALVGLVLYLALCGFQRTSEDTNIYIHNEIQINLPVYIAQTNAVLEEEIKTQVQPGRLTAMLNKSMEQDHTKETTTSEPYGDENIDMQSSSSGQHCLDYFNCFHFEVSEEAMTWHEAFRHCRGKDMFLPGRDIYFELRYGRRFPNFMKAKASRGLWSSGKVEHGHYQFLDAKPGFSVSLFSPTIRGFECVKFTADRNNLTSFTVANCRDKAATICISPAAYFINKGQVAVYTKPTVSIKEAVNITSSEAIELRNFNGNSAARRRSERRSSLAPFPVQYRPMHMDVVEVLEEDLLNIELQCNNISEDRVIWTMDGIFFKNGVRNTHLYRAPYVSSGPPTLQGAYGCETWNPAEPKRITSSNKVYVTVKDTALVTAIIKKQGIDASAISCTRNPFGCDHSVARNCCWYWDIAERVKAALDQPWNPVSWYSVDETVTLTDDLTFNSRVTINFFVKKWNLLNANWSNMTDPEIMHMTVMEPYQALRRRIY